MKFADSPNNFCFILLALILGSVQFCSAEITFTEHVVSDDYTDARSIMALDIDFDGDLDLLTTGHERVSLWKNNGEQEFTEYRLFNENTFPPDTADMNGDGEIDIVITVEGYLSWYENNGDEEFTQNIIMEDIGYINYISALDLDGDNDIDIFSIAADPYWFENTEDQGFLRHRIGEPFWIPFSLYMSDIDNNGHMDALIGVSDTESIRLYRNNGDRSFTEHDLSERGMESHAVHAVDIDGDNDQDLITDIGEEIRLWENIGENNFRIRTIDNTSSEYLDSGDFDGDGDVDLVSNNRITFNWYENEGEYNFTHHRFSREFEESWGDVKVADMDNDGDLDFLGTVGGEGLILWFENEEDTLSVAQNDEMSATGFTFNNIYPNPFNSTTTIEYNLPYASDVSLSLYNIHGQLVDVLLDGVMPAGSHKVKWDGHNVGAGVYFLKLSDRTGSENFTNQKVTLIK
jgi:hypothetical protein